MSDDVTGFSDFCEGNDRRSHLCNSLHVSPGLQNGPLIFLRLSTRERTNPDPCFRSVFMQKRFHGGERAPFLNGFKLTMLWGHRFDRVCGSASAPAVRFTRMLSARLHRQCICTGSASRARVPLGMHCRRHGQNGVPIAW